ncbi:hypothetical protein A3715_16720 [Oleiphilus sp. HI0009]|nr:hypothetical protein A3715_17720 [Oleiphilus sp. HI0009]KZX86054.1 hypothetical protein A3715_16720 [Oleiphilus sp. HI0009]
MNFQMYYLLLFVIAISFKVDAAPLINDVDRTETNELVISGSGFSSKAVASPLLYWRADEGIQPSALGVKNVWDSSFNGELVSNSDPNAIIADGSISAVRLDYSKSSNAILAKVSFNSDRLYVWRKRYDDFDADYAYAIRTRLDNVTRLVSGAQFESGVVVRLPSSGIVGKVISASHDEAKSSATLYYSDTYGDMGNINAVTGNVEDGDQVFVYAESDKSFSQPLFSANLNEGKGVYYTFNHKTIRLWGDYPDEKNNTYVSLGNRVDSPLALQSMLVNEYTQTGTFWGKNWIQMIDHATRRWVREELQYQAGDVDVENGLLDFWQDGKRGWENKMFRFTTSQYPQKYSDLYMNQVSNGAAPNTFEYYDSLYVDGTWHRVIACEAPKVEDCRLREIQVPISWSDSDITVKPIFGALKRFTHIYFYVFDSEGNVNQDGYRLLNCSSCAKSPLGFTATQSKK